MVLLDREPIQTSPQVHKTKENLLTNRVHLYLKTNPTVLMYPNLQCTMSDIMKAIKAEGKKIRLHYDSLTTDEKFLKTDGLRYTKN